jgi:hypothetical protein
LDIQIDKAYQNEYGLNLRTIAKINKDYYNEYKLSFEETVKVLKSLEIPLNQLNDESKKAFHFEIIDSIIYLTNGVNTIVCSSITRTIHDNYLIFPYILPSSSNNIYFNSKYFDGREIQLSTDILFYIAAVKAINDVDLKEKFIFSLNKFWDSSYEDADKMGIIRIINEAYENQSKRLEFYYKCNSLGFFSLLILYHFNIVAFRESEFIDALFDERTENRFNLHFSFSTHTLNIESLQEFANYIKNHLNTRDKVISFFEIPDLLLNFEELSSATPYSIISRFDKAIPLDFPSFEEWSKNENRYGNYTSLYNLEKYTNSINFKNIEYKHTDKHVKEKHNIIKEYCKRINIKLRTIENQYRLDKGFNIVGSLVNESILFKKIKEHFKEHRVISQGSPSWLSPQRLDIYFPDLNIAVEYQGVQHFKPIEYYGGIEGYKRTIERDNRKRYLCKRHKCQLLEVLPNYDFEIVKNQIQTMILNTGKR